MRMLRVNVVQNVLAMKPRAAKTTVFCSAIRQGDKTNALSCSNSHVDPRKAVVLVSPYDIG